MITIIGILVGAIIVALIGMCSYFSREMAKLRYKINPLPEGYRTSYAEYRPNYSVPKQKAEDWEMKYWKLADESYRKENEWEEKYDELRKRCDNLQKENYNLKWTLNEIEPFEEKEVNGSNDD